MRVNLIHAPLVDADTRGWGAWYMPAWAFTLAAHIPRIVPAELRLFDLRVRELDDVTEADLFLYSGLLEDEDKVLSALRWLRSRFPHARHVLGGPICRRLDQEDLLPRVFDFDHLVIGDGEDVVGSIVASVARAESMPKIIRVAERFDLERALALDRALLARYAGDYYGGIVEVTRGCPFLCEFCAVRILPDNNRMRNKPAATVLGDLDAVAQHGLASVKFIGDNFVGDLNWAHEVIDQIIAWRETRRSAPGISLSLTINVHQHPDLLRKMRLAGVDALEVGLESFNRSSLLETAKVQNASSLDLPAVIRYIQSFGFIVQAGLILGFDSDGPDLFTAMLRGMEASNMLTNGAGFLTAMPGTPLHRRMRLAGRLRSRDQKHGARRFGSNIRFLLPSKLLREGYLDFSREIRRGRFRYARLKGYLEGLDSPNYVPRTGVPVSNSVRFAKTLGHANDFARQVRCLLDDPTNAYYALKGLALVLRRSRRGKGASRVYLMWLLGWMQAQKRHLNVRPEDIDVEGLDREVRPEDILPTNYCEDAEEPIPRKKTEAQLRETVRQLTHLIAEVQAGETPG